MVPGPSRHPPAAVTPAVPSRGRRVAAVVVALLGLAGSSPQNAKGTGLEALALWLEVKPHARTGEWVPLKLKVKNGSKRPVELTLGGRPAHDFVALKADGTEVWRWSHGQVIQEILEVKTLQPGEDLGFEGAWRQVDNARRPVAAGIYFLRGVLNLEPPERMVTAPVQLRISP